MMETVDFAWFLIPKQLMRLETAKKVMQWVSSLSTEIRKTEKLHEREARCILRAIGARDARMDGMIVSSGY